MPIFYKWTDFVIYPDDAARVTSIEQRLDTSKAIVVKHHKDMPFARTHGALPQKSEVVFNDDEFEAMEITEQGEVFIWTKQRVWRLFRLHGYEKLIFFPRHPPISYEVMD